MTMINPPHKGSDAIKREMAKEDKQENQEDQPEEKGCSGSNKLDYPKHKDQKSVLSEIGIKQFRPWEAPATDWFNAYRDQQDTLEKYRKERKQ